MVSLGLCGGVRCLRLHDSIGSPQGMGAELSESFLGCEEDYVGSSKIKGPLLLGEGVFIIRTILCQGIQTVPLFLEAPM